MDDQFYSMPKIPRYYREIVITEKIDGTNGCIVIDDVGLVRAGSKSRWLTSESKATDNFEFAAWVEENEDTLLKDLGPGWHRGEWWGKGINRNYGLTNRRFSLFQSARWTDAEFSTPNLEVVPVLYKGTHSGWSVGETLTGLAAIGSAAAPGFLRPEGIVVYHTAGRHSYKITLENDAEPKGRGSA
jgi:hypothetical protein